MFSQHITSTWNAGGFQAHLPEWSAAATNPAHPHASYNASLRRSSSSHRALAPSHANSHSLKHLPLTVYGPAIPPPAGLHTPTAARPPDPPHPLTSPPPRSVHQAHTLDGSRAPRPRTLLVQSRSYTAGGLTPLLSQQHEQSGLEWVHATGTGPGSFLQLQQAAVARSASERRIQRLLHKIDSVCSIRSASSNRSSSSGASLSHGGGAGPSRGSSTRERDHAAADLGADTEAGASAVVGSTVGTSGRSIVPGSSRTQARGLQPYGGAHAGGASAPPEAPLLGRQRRLSAPDQVLGDVGGGSVDTQGMGGAVGRTTSASREDADGRWGASTDGAGAPDRDVRGRSSRSSSGGGSNKASSLNGSRFLAGEAGQAGVESEAVAGQQPNGLGRLAPAVPGCSDPECDPAPDPEPDLDGLGERELSVRQLVRPEAAASASTRDHAEAHSGGGGGDPRLRDAAGADAGRVQAVGQGRGAVARAAVPSGVARDPAAPEVRGADDLLRVGMLGGRGSNDGGRRLGEGPAAFAAMDGGGLAVHAHLRAARAAGGTATPTPLGATGGEGRWGEQVHRRAEGGGQAGEEGPEGEGEQGQGQEQAGGQNHANAQRAQHEGGGGGLNTVAPWRLSSSGHVQLLPGDGLAQLAPPVTSARAPANTPILTPLRGGPSRVASGRAGRFLDATFSPSHGLLALSSDLSAQIDAALQHTHGHRAPSTDGQGHPHTPAATPADGAAGAVVRPHASSGALAVLQEAARLVAQIDQDLRAGAAAARRRTSGYPRPSPAHPHANPLQELLTADATPAAASAVPAQEGPELPGQVAAGPHRRTSTPPVSVHRVLAAEGLGPLQRRGSHQTLHGLAHGEESVGSSSRASSVGDGDGPEDLQALLLSAQPATALAPAPPAHSAAEPDGRSKEALLAEGGSQPRLGTAAATGVAVGAAPGSPAGSDSDSGSTLSSIMRHLEEHLGPRGAGPAPAVGERPASQTEPGLGASGTKAASQLGPYPQGHQQGRSPGRRQLPLGPAIRHTPHSLSLADLDPLSAATAGAGVRIPAAAPALARGLAVGPMAGDASVSATAPGSRALSGRALLSRTSRGMPSTEAALHVSEPSEVGPEARSGAGGASGAPVGGTTAPGIRDGGSFRVPAGLLQQQQQQLPDGGRGVQQHAGGEAVDAVGVGGLLVDVEGVKRDLERLLGGAGLR